MMGRGVKRSIDEWEALAEKIKTTAERRSEESKNPGAGMDISRVRVTRETRAASTGESDVKFDETALELIESAGTWREYQKELCYDTRSGEVMIKELARGSSDRRMLGRDR